MIRKRKRDKWPRFGKENHHAGVVQSEISEARHRFGDFLCFFLGSLRNIYDLQGRRVKPVKKGLYVKDGKTVVIK